MLRAPVLPARTAAVVFDAYGTLFDVHSAVRRHATGADAERLSAVWREKQLEYTWVLSLAGCYESFAVLTERALDHAFAVCPRVDPALRARLLEAYRRLDAYPDARATLAALKQRGLSTGILSNGDLPMLREAVASARLDDLVDALWSVEAARVFKTDPRAYALVGAALGTAPDTVAFVSSNRWDVAGAAAFGFAPIWVNRSGSPDEYPGLDPIATVSSLSEIAAGAGT